MGSPYKNELGGKAFPQIYFSGLAALMSADIARNI